MTTPENITVAAEIRRYDPADGGAPKYERYEVTGIQNMRVLDVLRSVYENQAGDLAFQFACRIGRCGTCAVKVNGVPVLACQETCKPQMRIEPLTPFRVLRDLVVDRGEVEGNYTRLKLTPQRAAPHRGKAEPIDAGLAEHLCHMGSCLACMVCVAGCPAVEERPFDGPAFLLKLRHMAEHPADCSSERVDQAIEAGMLECFNCNTCTQLCPADLDPAQAIREFRHDLLLGAREKQR